MSTCVVCSSPASQKCAACQSVSYCTPAHQKEDWKAHKKVCPRLVHEAREAKEHLALLSQGAVCAVCSSPSILTCSQCTAVFYCTPGHQKEDWKAHKIQCPRLALESLSRFHPCAQELLLRITACLAQNGNYTEVGVMVQLNKAFWNDEQIWDVYKDVAGPRGRTRLMYSSGFGSLSRIRWLMERGANANIASAHFCSTALMLASREGRLETVRELVNKGAKVDDAWNGMPHVGFTALMFACREGHLKTVRVLCARGADVNRATCDGTTALLCASSREAQEIVLELCERGANVNAAVNRGNNLLTPLMTASYQGHLETVRLLLLRGANKAATAADGSTAFSLATGQNKAALQALLKP